MLRVWECAYAKRNFPHIEGSNINFHTSENGKSAQERNADLSKLYVARQNTVNYFMTLLFYLLHTVHI